MKSVCIAVLNYNGVPHLKALIPSLLAARAQSPVPTSIVILDNRSPQGDAAWVQEHHGADVRCLVAPRNDYLFSYNWLLPRLTEDIVVLLNNDVRVAPDFVAGMLRHFAAADVFAVSGLSYDWEGREITSGPSELRQAHGFYNWKINRSRQTVCHTFFCSGSCMAVDRAKFLELDGFHRLYYPAYCEDLDLCFRAWRRGWRCLYEPSSIYWHREHGSWGTSPDGHPTSLNLKGSLLFQWASLPAPAPWGLRRLSTAKLLIGEWLQGKSMWSTALREAGSVWRQARASHHDLKVSRNELERILAAVAAPVHSSAPPQHLTTPPDRAGASH